MHTVELLDEAVSLAAGVGFGIRQEWLGGSMAGACEVKGRRWIFIDLALTPLEQLDQVLGALRELPSPPHASISPQLQALLYTRKAA